MRSLGDRAAAPRPRYAGPVRALLYVAATYLVAVLAAT
jgi:hypothetical protein